MTVHFIGAGPGAADLITLRGQKLIESCKVCLYAGSLVPSEILTHCPEDAQIINTAPLDLDAIIEECKRATELGYDVARLHSGDLSIWSAMGEQLRRLREEKINFTLTPGVTSFSTAAAALGTELTLPNLTQSVVLTRTSGRASAMPDDESLENFARTKATLAIHLSIHNLTQVVEKLIPFYGDDCSAAVVYRASWPDQKIFRGTLVSFKDGVSEDIERTALILVGPVLGNETFAESSLYSTDYDRRFRPQSADEGKKIMKQPPGLLISAPSSGTGKTTVMLGLLRALRDKGLLVQPFKSGPDYIDPAFHFAAAGRNSYNLDSWAMSDALMDNLVALSDGADLILTEGSMGLYDGVAKPGQFGHGSSAETALAFGWPVILIVDVSGQAQSSAATALGFSNYNKEINIAGVILNRVASPRHERLARLGFEKAGLKVLGALPRRGDLVLPERHLGLIQAVEHPNLEKAIADYGVFLASNVDLDQLQQLAQSGVKASNSNSQLNLPSPPGQRIALARDEVFSFTYPHILRHWHSSGAELSFFSPVLDETPDKSADIIWMPGGYPELHAGKLATAENCFSAIRDHARTRPVHGECGGYMVLGSHLIDKEGISHKMVGLLGLVTSYAKRKFNLGYRIAETNSPVEIFSANKKLRGHEFHYSSIIEQPDEPLFSVKDAEGNTVSETGSVCGKVSGTFFHMIAEAD